MTTAELRAVYAFDCDHCGRECIVRPVVVEFMPDEARKMSEAEGMHVQTGEWVAMPKTAKCKHCGAVYRTSEPD